MIILSSLSFLAGLSILSWGIYGIGSVLFCGFEQAQCRLVNIETRVRVCQNFSDYTFHPYEGIAIFCFDAYIPAENKTTVLCIEERASCSSDLSKAFDVARTKFPKGAEIPCWYRISSDYTENNPRFDLSWGRLVDSKGQNIWLWLNVGYSGFVLSIILLACLIITIRNCMRVSVPSFQQNLFHDNIEL